MLKKMLYLCVFAVFSICAGCYDRAPEAREGFLGDDAYRVLGYGSTGPRHEKSDLNIRKRMACMAAEMDAQRILIEKFGGAGLDSLEGTTIVHENLKEFSGIIRRGRVVEVNFDEETNECNAVYEIREPGLKNKILNAGVKL